MSSMDLEYFVKKTEEKKIWKIIFDDIILLKRCGVKGKYGEKMNSLKGVKEVLEENGLTLTDWKLLEMSAVDGQNELQNREELTPFETDLLNELIERESANLRMIGFMATQGGWM